MITAELNYRLDNGILSMLYFPCEKLSAPSDLGLITTAMEKVPNATSRDITNEGKEKKKI